MNNKQCNAIRGLLHKYDIKDVSNMVRINMGISFDKLIKDADALYVIPRIASCYGEAKQKVLTTLHKEWLKDVVEKRFSPVLDEHTDKYGARAVTQAIYYLIDNNLWKTYPGRLALGQEDNKSYYDGLQDLPSAIAKVTEDNPDLLPRKIEPAQPTSNKRDEIIGAAKNASTAIESLIDNVHLIVDYVKNNVDTDKVSQQVEQANKRIAELSKQLESKDATIKEQTERIAKMKQDEKEQDGYYKELHDKYNALLDERDAISKENDEYAKLLEEAAQYEKKPKKKVIPESVLLDVPLIGQGALKGLRVMFEKYNIYIDPNK